MTDKTRQDSGNTHIIRYALELGLLWIDGDGRDKVREALDELDTLEAQLEAIGAGGVQALSAAPAVPADSLVDAFLKWCAALDLPTDTIPNSTGKAPNGGIFSDPRTRAAWGWETSAHRFVAIRRMLAASPTPPAEQAAPKAAPGEPDKLMRDCLALLESFDYEDDEDSQSKAFFNAHINADWFFHVKRSIERQLEAKAAPQQEPVWDGKLSDAMQNALDALYLECGPGITRDITHQVQKECEAIYTSYTTTKRMYQAARDRLDLLEAAQPQPAPFAAPQPAPAPLSDDAKDAARYRFLAGHCRSTSEHWGGWWSIIVDGPAPKSHDSENDFDEAVDAALAAQGGK